MMGPQDYSNFGNVIDVHVYVQVNNPIRPSQRLVHLIDTLLSCTALHIFVLGTGWFESQILVPVGPPGLPAFRVF